MKQEPKPPQNRDQVLPPRKGDTIDSQPTPERPGKERKRDAVPEEESYERESPTRRNTDEERIAHE
jgi:hypothetical protein